METGIETFFDHFPLTKQELKSYSSLGLAYIGDCVFELFVRTMVVTKGNDRASHYHKKTIGFVNAAAQTKMMNRIKPLLTEEEMAVFRRGKNAKSASPAKNQSLHDYHYATGFEALMGYLYLSGQKERLGNLLAVCFAGEEGEEE
ncbi:MAG: ribonuclease III [Eubacterium sp.]|nr:ribonuclease III [Eubacterium sp.]MDD7208990.1 ribonuclease III domain-containing protein [Lachnospiraceae bacterium]MDY5498053.1 ribonuclease III domain-containing protein [Anaerobutyricum sp.]